MSQRKRHRPAHNKAAMIEKLRRLALAVQPDAKLDPELFEHMEAMVRDGFDQDVEALLNDEALSEAAADAVDFALDQAGYRPTLSVRSPGKEEPELGVLVPFALLITVVARSPADLERLPVELPETVTRMTDTKWLRRVLQLPDAVSLAVDGQLYHADHAEWLRPSLVRHYLAPGDNTDAGATHGPCSYLLGRCVK